MLDFIPKSAILFEVMREKTKTEKKHFKCWYCAETHRLETKMDWGIDYVCPKCFDYLFMEDEIREKRRW